MKTTVDLPDDLVKAMKYRAVREGRKLKDVMTELIQSGLSQPNVHPDIKQSKEGPIRRIDPRSGFMVIHGRKDAIAQHMTIEEILSMEQRAQEEEDLLRCGLSPGR